MQVLLLLSLAVVYAGRGIHPGRGPDVHLGVACGTGSRVVMASAHLDHTPEKRDPVTLGTYCNG